MNNKSVDEYVAFALVNAIPNAYSDFRSTMKYGKDNVTVELVMSSLRTKELELKQVDSKSENKVMYVRGNNNDKKYVSKKWINTRRYYNYGEVCDLIKDCPKPLERRGARNWSHSKGKLISI